MIRIEPVEFVCRTPLKVQLQLAELRLRNYNRVFRQGQLRTVLVPGFRQEHTVPLCPARGDVINVKYCLGETLVEDARLHLKGDLIGDERRFNASEGTQRERSGPQRH